MLSRVNALLEGRAMAYGDTSKTGQLPVTNRRTVFFSAERDDEIGIFAKT